MAATASFSAIDKQIMSDERWTRAVIEKKVAHASAYAPGGAFMLCLNAPLSAQKVGEICEACSKHGVEVLSVEATEDEAVRVIMGIYAKSGYPRSHSLHLINCERARVAAKRGVTAL